MYRIIRLTSIPLNKTRFTRSDIKHKNVNVDVQKVIDKPKVQQTKPKVDRDDKPKEKPKVENKPIEIRIEEPIKEQPEANTENGEKKNVLGLLFKSNKDEDGENKFSIWEDIPEEPRDTAQLEAAKLINQDGYYDTIIPDDIEEDHEQIGGFNWKIPLIIIVGLLILAGLGYYMFF